MPELRVRYTQESGTVVLDEPTFADHQRNGHMSTLEKALKPDIAARRIESQRAVRARLAEHVSLLGDTLVLPRRRNTERKVAFADTGSRLVPPPDFTNTPAKVRKALTTWAAELRTDARDTFDNAKFLEWAPPQIGEITGQRAPHTRVIDMLSIVPVESRRASVALLSPKQRDLTAQVVARTIVGRFGAVLWAEFPAELRDQELRHIDTVLAGIQPHGSQPGLARQVFTLLSGSPDARPGVDWRDALRAIQASQHRRAE